MEIISFQQTPFVSYENENLIRVKVGDWDYCNPFEVSVHIEGKTVFQKEIMIDNFDVLLPINGIATKAVVKLTPFEDSPVYYTYILKQPKQWEVALMYSAHEDLGYCAYYDKLDIGFYEYLMRAIELCEKNEGFKYVIEHYEWLRGFERYATKQDNVRLKALFDKRKIELNAPQCGVHTHWAEGMQLIDNLGFSTKKAARKWDIRPVSAIYADISGISHQSVSAYAGQGIKYLGILKNNFRCDNNKGQPAVLSRWVAPNGKDSVLLWYQVSYMAQPFHPIWCEGRRRPNQGDLLFDNSKAKRTEIEIANRINGLGNVPYNVLPLSIYDDREFPTDYLLDVCKFMNSKWKFPIFKMEIPSVFLETIEKQSGNELPVINGDITDQWADFATISPRDMSTKREAMRRKKNAELLNTMSAINGEIVKSKEYFEEITRLGGLFDEHCWATSSKHPAKMHFYNYNLVKKLSANKAYTMANQVIEKQLGVPQDNVSLYNILPYERTASALIDKNLVVPSGIDSQKLPLGGYVTEPINFSASERKNFTVNNINTEEGMQISGDFETDFYKVKIDLNTKQIESIIDKTANIEIIDKTAPFGFGEYVYVVTEGKTSETLYYEKPKKNEIYVYEGNVAFVIIKKSYEEQSGASIISQFIFYKYEKNIDIEFSFENATGLMGDFYDRYKKNIFLSLPIYVNNPEFFTQLSGGGAHSHKEKVQLCPLDFSVTENFVAVQGDKIGVAIYSADMPVFHFGNINYNKFMTSAEYKTSNLYLYCASNRANMLSFANREDCCGKYRLSLLPYQGSYQDGVQKWADEKANPIYIGDGNKASTPKISIDRYIRLLSFSIEDKNSLMAIFSEVNGKDEKRVVFELPFIPKSVSYVTLLGKYIKDAEIKGNTVIFDIDKYSYAALKITVDFKIEEQAFVHNEIFNVLNIDIEQDGQIVSFEKREGLKAKSFKIYGDGRFLKEIPNSSTRIERTEIDCRPEKVDIEICK